MISHIMEQREKSWLGKAEIIVKHTGGVTCQKEMRRYGATLEDGATRYIGWYICDDCNIAVSVMLKAHPDVPFELYQGSEQTVIQDE